MNVDRYRFHDFSGNGIDGTPTNDPVFMGGDNGKSLYCVAGSSQYVSMGDFADSDLGTSGDFSVSMWVKIDSTESFGDVINLFGKGYVGGEPRFEIQFDDLTFDRLSVEVGDSGGQVVYAGPQNIKDSIWHHIAVTFDRDTETLIYHNGTLDSSHAGTSSYNVDSASNVVLGAADQSGYGFARYSTAYFDEVLFYTRVLNPWEIAQLYRHQTPWLLSGISTSIVGMPQAAGSAAGIYYYKMLLG